jgi:hypothetical protein
MKRPKTPPPDLKLCYLLVAVMPVKMSNKKEKSLASSIIPLGAITPEHAKIILRQYLDGEIG